MKCVYAIGEKLPDREKGLEATMAVCIDQLSQVKSLLDPEKANAWIFFFGFRKVFRVKPCGSHIGPVVNKQGATLLFAQKYQEKIE